MYAIRSYYAAIYELSVWIMWIPFSPRHFIRYTFKHHASNKQLWCMRRRNVIWTRPAFISRTFIMLSIWTLSSMILWKNTRSAFMKMGRSKQSMDAFLVLYGMAAVSPWEAVKETISRITSYNVCYTKLLRTNESRHTKIGGYSRSFSNFLFFSSSDKKAPDGAFLSSD